MGWQTFCFFSSIVYAFVVSVWLFTIGGRLARNRHIAQQRAKWRVSTLIGALLLIGSDWFSGYFLIFVSVQALATLLSFTLGFGANLLFPKLKTPTGAFFEKILNILNSPFFPWP
ncbi:MAG: hypothetical protein ACKOWK_04265 [Micrococcales bacterium]